MSSSCSAPADMHTSGPSSRSGPFGGLATTCHQTASRSSPQTHTQEASVRYKCPPQAPHSLPLFISLFLSAYRRVCVRVSARLCAFLSEAGQSRRPRRCEAAQRQPRARLQSNKGALCCVWPTQSKRPALLLGGGCTACIQPAARAKVPPAGPPSALNGPTGVCGAQCGACKCVRRLCSVLWPLVCSADCLRRALCTVFVFVQQRPVYITCR